MGQNLVRRLVAGDPYRRSRLHDEKGNRIPARELRHLPRSLWWAVRRRVNAKLPEVPWITFDAIARLDELLQPDWRMIEFGSGMSTRWYAERVAALHSIEDNRDWHDRVAPSLPANVRYEYREAPAYWDVSDYQDLSLDVAVIDGSHRAECMAAVLPKIKRQGWVYLDNSDKDMTIPNGSVRRAERALREAVATRGGHLEQATGLTVGMLVPNQWTLAQLGFDDAGP